jgi:hypothetical protein
VPQIYSYHSSVSRIWGGDKLAAGAKESHHSSLNVAFTVVESWGGN